MSSTVQELAATIAKLSPAELEEFRSWLEKFARSREIAERQVKRQRSVRHLRKLSGKWTGELVLRSGDLAEEMIARG